MSSAVKERPILFSGEMVRAILDGRKTQTRRLVKPQPETDNLGMVRWRDDGGYFAPSVAMAGVESAGVRCPFGGPDSRHRVGGTRLWVRETWKSLAYGPAYGIELHYAADGYDPSEDYAAREKHRRVLDPAPDKNDKWRFPNGGHFGPWRPSIHMPRWASRITLEVTGVRVERLRDISRDDAFAEGIEHDTQRREPFIPVAAFRDYSDPENCFYGDPIASFRTLWDKVNGDRAPWSSNPYVWVVSFRRVQP